MKRDSIGPASRLIRNCNSHYNMGGSVETSARAAPNMENTYKDGGKIEAFKRGLRAEGASAHAAKFTRHLKSENHQTGRDSRGRFAAGGVAKERRGYPFT